MGGGEYETLFNRLFEDIAPTAVDELWREFNQSVTIVGKIVINY